MAVRDLWIKRDGTRSARYGRGRRYRVSHPRFESRSFDVRRDADVYWAEVLRADERPSVASSTVGAMLDAWILGKRGLSRRGYTACLGDARHVRARWGSALTSEVRSHDIQMWVAGLAVERGPREDRKTRPASEALRRRLVQALRGALQIAVETGHIPANPVDRVRVPRDHRREPRYLTVDQLRTLADGARPHAALIWFLATTGLRIGEAVRLRVGSVDSQRRRVRVARAKSGRGRDVPVPASVLALLALDGRRPDDLVFVGPKGGVIHPDSFRARHWARAVETLGVPGLRIHDLRHTAASLAIASGADVKAVQAMLGHASATMTLDLYGHLLDSRLDDVGERLNTLIDVPKGVPHPAD